MHSSTLTVVRWLEERFCPSETQRRATPPSISSPRSSCLARSSAWNTCGGPRGASKGAVAFSLAQERVQEEGALPQHRPRSWVRLLASCLFLKLNSVDYPSDPTLEYTYPDATPTIVASASRGSSLCALRQRRHLTGLAARASLLHAGAPLDEQDEPPPALRLPRQLQPRPHQNKAEEAADGTSTRRSRRTSRSAFAGRE